MFRAYAYFLPGLAFIGWIIYQLIFKKKRFTELINDILFILFFLAIWIGIYYWATH
jgi:hypothetical protein